MYKKFSQLSFVIGLFFTIVAIILLAHALVSPEGRGMTVNAAIAFLIFGIIMMLVKNRPSMEQD
jgi:hypothetical protein